MHKLHERQIHEIYRMKGEKMFRKLKYNEIDCRIGTVNKKGLTLLLYKDARVDMNILDEELGSMNWEKSYELIDGQLFCTVSIWDVDKHMWIKKSDVGTESNTEAEKGRASDAFKRACVNVGIGRELYTAPFIWIPAKACNITEENGKAKCYDKFFVTDIGYDENGNINVLSINSQDGANVFSFGKTMEKKAQEIIEEYKISSVKVDVLKAKCQKEGVPVERILKLYKVGSLTELTEKKFSHINLHWDEIMKVED